MKKMLMAGSVLALVLTTGLQASAARNNDGAKCAAGAVVGGIIGGIIGNGASNGNGGATVAGAGIGAIVGGSAACNANGNTSIDVTLGEDGRGGRWDDDYGHGGRGGWDDDYGRGGWDDGRGGRGGRGRWDDRDWRDDRGGRVRVAPGLIERTLRLAFNKPVGARSSLQGRDGSSVQIKTTNGYNVRRAYCIDYRIELWSARGNYSKQRGSACQTRDGEIYEQ